MTDDQYGHWQVHYWNCELQAGSEYQAYAGKKKKTMFEYSKVQGENNQRASSRATRIMKARFLRKYGPGELRVKIGEMPPISAPLGP